ncbi:nesprin-1 [Galendromus occidentalis]|uniref:Nesprin-1 n=1 Tax=Galendromus occidentalis TaxID=34638 RepID=A0AAJ7SFA3_9ACAR|nr:nesprin-1 [Galendromus occidentalis]
MADSPSSRRIRTPLGFLDATGSDDELGPSVENGIHVYTTHEYDRQICRNRDEQERVQKKVFVNWINHVLAQRVPPSRIKDLIEDLRDGTKLLALLEVLSGETLPGERGKILRRPHFISNVNNVLRFLERRRIKLVNINSTDVVDGKPAIILGLIWTIILHFQIEQHTALFQPSASSPAHVASPARDRESVADKWKGGARKALLQWVKNAISQRFGIHVNDFGPSWRDGMAFLAIVSRLKPSSVDLDAARDMGNRQRLDTAFNVAERELGIPKLIDSEDVDVAQPDEKSVMTYVAQFLHKYPESYSQVREMPTGSDPDLVKMSEFLTRAEDLLNSQSSDLNEQVKSYRSLKNEYRDLTSLYNSLRNRVRTETSIATQWPQVDQRWKNVGNLLKAWWQRLTSGLSYETLTFLQFLEDAEHRLAQPAIPPEMAPDDIARMNQIVGDHDLFLKDLQQIKQWFDSAKPDQFKIAALYEDSKSRLGEISKRASDRKLLLQLYQQRAKMLTIISKARGVFSRWRVPLALRDGLNHEWDAAKIQLETYTTDFAKLNLEFRAALDGCTSNGAMNFPEAERLGREITEQWDDVQTEMRSLYEILDQLFKNLRFYTENFDRVYGWIREAEMMVSATDSKKLEFFASAKQFSELKNRVVESGSFCQDKVQEPLASAIRNQLSDLQRRWNALSQIIAPFLTAGDSLKKRLDVQREIDSLKEAIAKHELLLNTRLPYERPALEKHADDLRKSQSELRSLDERCRELSRKVQGMVSELSAPEIEQLTNVLRMEKDKLVIVQGRLNSKLTQIQNLLGYLTSLLSELDTIPPWLDQAEVLISTYAAPVDKRSVETLLQKHRDFFSKLSEIQAVLDCKNKIMRDIKEEAGPANVDVGALDHKIASIYQRFTNVQDLSKQWEKALDEALTRWTNLEEHTSNLESWLSEAEPLVEKDSNVMEQVAFFSRPYQHLYLSFIASAKDVLSTVDPSQVAALSQRVTALQERYKAVIRVLPDPSEQSKLNQLNQKFMLHLENIRKELREELVLITSGRSESANVAQRHREFFRDCGDLKLLHEIIRDMEALATNNDSRPVHPFNSEMMLNNQRELKDVIDEIQRTKNLLTMSDKQYTEYQTRVNKLITWMDDVDKNVTTLLENDIPSSSDYEKLREKFNAICADVSSKEDDIKWLIRQLQQLIPNMTQEQATAEKGNLEFLVQRYQQLVPSIEMTTKVSETIHKIIIYREEVHKVTKWMTEIKTSELPVDQLQNIQREHQERVIKLEAEKSALLDEARRVAPGMVVPKALSQQVNQLQGDFTLVSECAKKNVQALQEQSEALARSCEDLKREILELLALAESNYSSFGKYSTPSELMEALRLKEEKHKSYIDKTQDLLRRLKQYKFEDSKFTEEVTKIEKQTHVVFNKVEEKSTKLKCAANKALKIAEHVGTTDLSDTSSANKAKVEQLISEVSEDNDLAEVLPMLPDIAQNINTAQQQFVKIQHAEKAQQALLTAIDEEFRQAESQVNDLTYTTPSFSRIEDCRSYLQKITTISNNAKSRITYADNLCSMEDLPEEAPQKIQELKSLWQKVDQRAAEKIERLTTALNERTQYDGVVERFEDWLEKLRQALRDRKKATNPHEVEQETTDLKKIAADIQEQQKSITDIQSRIDESKLSEFLHPEATRLQNRLFTIKKETTNIMDSIRKQTNELANVISEQKIVEKRIVAIEGNLQKILEQAPKTMSISQTVDKNTTIAKKIIDDTTNDINELMPSVKRLVEQLPGAARPLEQRLSALSSRISTQRELLDKRSTIGKDVNDFNNWQRDLIEQLKLLEQQLGTTKPSPEFLHKVKLTLKTIETTIVEKRQMVEGLQQRLNDIGLTLTDVDDKPTSLIDEVDKLQTMFGNVNQLFRRRTEQVEKMHAQLDQFNQSATSINTSIENLHSELKALRSIDSSYVALKEMRERLVQIQNTIPSSIIEQVNEMGRKLIEQDSSAISSVQNVLSAISKNFDVVSSDVDRRLANVDGARQMWDECRDLQNVVDSILKSTVEQIERAKSATGPEIPEASSQLKQTKGILIGQRPAVEQYARKVKTLCEKLEAVPGFNTTTLKNEAQDRISQFSVLYEQITQLLGNLENLNTALHQIEVARTSVDKWVTEMSSELDEALAKLSEPRARSVLDRYHIEAETQRNFLRSVRDKISSLNGILDTAPLTNQFDSVEQRLNSLQSRASLLESKLRNVQDAEDRIRQRLARFAEWLKERRDVVSKCDTDDISTSMRLCTDVKNSLESSSELQQINDEITGLQKEQEALDLVHLFKDLNNIEKRFANVLQQTNKTIQTMQSLMERKYQTAFNDAQRWIHNTDEKIHWTVSSNPAMDKFSVEAKLATLSEIASSMPVGREKLNALRQSVVQFPEKQNELSAVEDSFAQVEINLADNQAQLEHALQQWHAIEQMIANLGQWLSSIEVQAKSETGQAFSLTQNFDQQIETLESLLQTLNTRQAQFSQLEQMMSRITTDGSDASLENQVHHIVQRYKMIKTSLERAVSQLRNLISTKTSFNDRCQQVQMNTEKVEQVLALPCGNSKQELDARIEQLRALCNAKPELEKPVIEMSELGENIQGFLNIESRDQIRTQMRRLKDRWEDCWTKLYDQIKILDSSLLSWSGFEDTLGVVVEWLNQLEQQVSSSVELVPSLSDKITQLQSYKSLGQDICLHEPVMNKLREYSTNMSDQRVNAKVTQAFERHTQAQTAVQKCVELCSQRVNHHEDLKLKLCDMRSLIGDVESRIQQLKAVRALDGDSARKAIHLAKDILSCKPDGDRMLEAIRQLTTSVLSETAQAGHSVIEEETDAVGKAWDQLFGVCVAVCAESQSVIDAIETSENACKELEDWLVNNLPREHALKATARAKHEYVEELNQLEPELLNRQSQINALKNIHGEKVETLRNAYASGITNVRETTQKWTQNANLHSDFDIRSNDFDAWLSSCEVRFLDTSRGQGEQADVKKFLEDLLDHVTQKQAELDRLTDLAERVYPLTSADGRENIRSKLRDLVKRYERLCENLSSHVNKLEKSIGQIADLRQAQQVLESNIKDFLTGLNSNEQLKATLQEKKAQLQAHKLVNEDIISQKPVVMNMLQRTKNLDQAPDFVASVQKSKTEYEDLVDKSAKLLDRLGKAVEHHSELNDLIREFKEWLQVLSHQLEEHKDSTGDQEHIQSKLKSLNNLKSKFDQSESMLNRLQAAAERVYLSTNEAGIAAIQQEMTELEEALSQHGATRDEAQHNLENVIKQWTSFKKNQKLIENYLQQSEAEIQSIQQGIRNSSLQEKQELLKTAESLKETLESYQKTIDGFTDEGHSLYQASRFESIQTKVTQINSNYRALSYSLKKLITGLSTSLDGLQQFDKALAAFDMWFDDAQITFETKVPDSEWQPQRVQMQTLLGQCKSQGQTLLNQANAKAEVIMQDIPPTSRDDMRDGIKRRREKLDQLQVDIQEALRQLDIDSEIIGQLTQLLEEVDSAVEEGGILLRDFESGLPDTSRMHEMTHNMKVSDQTLRQLLGRLQLIRSKLRSEEYLRQVDDAADKVAKTMASLKNARTTLEDFTSLMSDFDELKSNHETLWQPKMKDRLKAGSDVSGSKSVLISRLDKLTTGVTNQIAEGEVTIAKLKDIIPKVEGRLQVATVSDMQATVGNFEHDLETAKVELDAATRRLADQSKQWQDFEDDYEKLSSLTNDWEAQIKEFSLKNTLDEKIELAEMFKELANEISSAQNAFDELGQDAEALEKSSGELRLSMQSSQLITRFQSVLATCKDIAKKTEQHVVEHKQYQEKYVACLRDMETARSKYDRIVEMPSGNKDDMTKKLEAIRGMLDQRSTLMNLVNICVQAGEVLQSGSSPAGWEIAQNQIKQLQDLYDSIFDGLAALDKSLQAASFLLSEYEESLRKMRLFIDYMSNQLLMIKLEPTFDKKRATARRAQDSLSEMNDNVYQVEELQTRAKSVPGRDAESEQALQKVLVDFERLHGQLKDVSQEAENRVMQHERLRTKVTELSDWLNCSSQKIDACLDTGVDKVTMRSNLETLRSILNSFDEKRAAVAALKETDVPAVLQGTHHDGHAAIKAEIDALEKRLDEMFKGALQDKENLEETLSRLDDTEKQAELLRSWLSTIESELRSIMLGDKLSTKQKTLDNISEQAAQILSKESEVMSVVKAVGSLADSASGEKKISRLSDLESRFKHMKSFATEQESKWQNFVANHSNFDQKIREAKSKLSDALGKLGSIEQQTAGEVADLEGNIATVQLLLKDKDEIFSKINVVSGLCEGLLGETAPAGHAALHNAVQELQDMKGDFVSRLNALKRALDEQHHVWKDYLNMVNQVTSLIEQAEGNLKLALQPQDTLSEKRAQWESVKHLLYVMKQDESTVFQLKNKTAKLIESKPPNRYTEKGERAVNRYHELVSEIESAISTLNEIYAQHSKLKECADELIGWMRQIRSKIPNLTKSLSDRLALEAAIEDLEKLLPKRKQGSEKMSALLEAKSLVLRDGCTSEAGRKMVETEVGTLRNDFHGLCNEIEEVDMKLQQVWAELKQFRKDYEEVSEELLQVETEIKSYKQRLQPDLEAKDKNVDDIKACIQHLDDIKEQADDIANDAKNLLASHLESYIRNQLSVLTSRLQVAANLARDVLGRAEEACEQHRAFAALVHKAKDWIHTATARLNACSGAKDTREELEAQLNSLQELLRKMDEGQSLVHSVVNSSDRVVRSTHQDGKQTIIDDVHKLQSDLEMLMSRLGDAKVAAESALMQWDDFKSSEKRMRQWIEDHKKKLSDLKTYHMLAPGDKGVSQRRVRFRRYQSLAQDIESFEPMIESVTSKGRQLQRDKSAAEIEEQFKELSGSAKSCCTNEGQLLQALDKFADACQKFISWQNAASERVSKGSQPSGDQNELQNRVDLLKNLNDDKATGNDLLSEVVSTGTESHKCLLAADEPEDADLVNVEVETRKKDYDDFLRSCDKLKQLIESGLELREDYEAQYRKCSEWLDATQPPVENFDRLYGDLYEKRKALEEFQQLLQVVFEWQPEFDVLNNKAQKLLDMYSDSTISTSVAQLSNRYTNFVSKAKDILHDLEQHFQEHQQQQCIYSECIEVIDRTKEKLEDLPTSHETQDGIESKVACLKTLASTLEHNTHRISYLDELTEKVIKSTSADGAHQVESDSANVKQDLQSLVDEVAKRLREAQELLEEFTDFTNEFRRFSNYLDELKLDDVAEKTTLPDKKLLFDKYKFVMNDLESFSDLASKLRSKEGGKFAEKAKLIVQKYDSVLQTVQDQLRSLEWDIKTMEEYMAAAASASEWLADAHDKVKKCNDTSGSENAIRERREILRTLRENLAEGERLVTQCSFLWDHLKPTWVHSVEEHVTGQLRQMEEDFESLKQLFASAEEELDKCLSSWENFNSLFDSLSRWIGDFESATKTAIAEVDSDSANWPSLEKTLTNLLSDASNKRSDVDSLNQLCENLVASTVRVREQVVSISSNYASLVGSLKDSLAKVQKSQVQHEQFENARNAFTDWLKNALTVFDNNREMSMKDIGTRVERLQTLNSDIPTGRNHLANVVEAGTRLLLSSSSDSNVRSDIDNMQKELTKLSSDLSETLSKLLSLSKRWSEAMTKKQILAQWIEKMSRELQSPLPSGDVVQIRNNIEFCKSSIASIEQQSIKLDELLSEVVELCERTGDHEIISELDELRERLNVLHGRTQSALESLESDLAALQAYQKLLQETEKWLLQMNMQIMAQHSLQILNCEQTEKELEKYQSLLNEVRAYETNITDVCSTGQALIDAYEASAPQTAETVSQQIDNIRESYTSLLAAAIKIQSRLENALEKFRAYEKMISYCEGLLNETESSITGPQEQPKTKDAIKFALDAKQAKLNQLSQARDSLQSAIQSCLDAVSSVSRPSSPEVSQVFKLPEQEVFVKIRLQDCIEQLEQQIQDLSELLVNMENVTKRLEEARRWLAAQHSLVGQISKDKLSWDLGAIHGNLRKLEGIAVDLTGQKDTLEKFLLSTHVPMDEAISGDFAALRTKLDESLEQQRDHLEKVEGLNTLVDEIRAKINDVEASLVAADKPARGNAKQRQQALQAILMDCDVVDERISAARTQLGLLKGVLQDQDYSKLHDELGEATKKSDDQRKRILRRSKSLDLIQTNFDALANDIKQGGDWADEKLASLRASCNPGYSPRPIEDRLQDSKVCCSEVQNMSLILPDLESRTSSLINDLDTFDSQKLNQSLDDLRSKFANVKDLAENRRDDLAKVLDKSRELESILKQCHQFINEKRSEKVDREIPISDQLRSYQKKLSELKQFEDSTLKELLRRGFAMEQHCDPEAKESLKSEIQKHVDDFNALTVETVEKIQLLSKLSETEEEFNRLMNSTQHLLDETEASAQTDVITDAAPSVLEEQIQSFNRLHNATRRLSGDLGKLKELRDDLRPRTKLAKADRIEVFEQLKTKLRNDIDEKIRLLRDSFENQSQLRVQIKELRSKLEDLSRQYDQLNGPIGGTVDDAKTAVLSSQKLQDELHELENEINTIVSRPFLKDEITSLSNDASALGKRIERLLAKVRNGVQLREAFYRIVESVKETATKVEDTLRHIDESRKSLAERIPVYTQSLSDLGEAEGQLQVAQDKLDKMAPDTIVADQNDNQQTLQQMKNSLLQLRKRIQDLQVHHESMLKEQAKLLGRFDKLIQNLQDDETKVKQRPQLSSSGDDIARFLNEQQSLEKSVDQHLLQAEELRNEVMNQVPENASRFEEKLGELARYNSSLPRDLQDRRLYLEEARAMRLEMKSHLDAVAGWIESANCILQQTVDYDNLDKVTSDLKSLVSESEEHDQSLKACQSLLPKLRSTMRDDDAIALDRTILGTAQEFHDLVSRLQKKLADLTDDMNLVNNLKKLLQKAQALISKVKLSEGWPDSIPAVQLRIKELKKASKDMQAQQSLINEFNAVSAVLEQKASPDTRKHISAYVAQVNDQWQKLLSDIADQLKVLEDVLHKWESYMKTHNDADTKITHAENELKQGKATINDLDAADTILQSLETSLVELREIVRATDDLSRPVLAYLVSHGSEQNIAIEKQVQSLKDRIERLETDIGEQLALVKEEKQISEHLNARIEHLSKQLQELAEQVKDLDVMSDDENLEHFIEQMRQDVQDLSKEVRDMAESTNRRYLSRRMSIPDAIGQALSSLEVLSEAVSGSLDDKEKQFTLAVKCRKEYIAAVRKVVEWLERAQQTLQDKESNISEIETQLMSLSSQVPDIKHTMHNGVTRNGQQIAEWSTDTEEKTSILSTISSLGEKLVEVDNWIQERLLQVKNAHHLRERFLALHENLQKWIGDNMTFLTDKEPLVTLDVTKRRVAKAKEMKHDIPQSQGYLNEMGTLINKIGDICDIADLLAILDADEEQQSSTESHLVEEVTLLNEMIEEWEQCERKIKEVTDWIGKCFSKLESPQGSPQRNKNLREQLNMREKILKDVATQRTRLAMAIEKLLVHFKDRNYSGQENQMVLQVGELSLELARLQADVDQQCQTLSVCLSQEEQYQQDLQRLRQLLAMSERQLKIACSPAMSVQEKQEQLKLQQIFRDQIASYKSQVTELQERLKKLQNKHLPDVEPFRVKIQALPKDLVASKPHLAALMEVPEHRPYVRTPRASARPSREASPDRPMSSLSWFLPTPSGPAASGITPEALLEGVFQSPKLVSTLGGADDDDVTDIRVPVPTPTPPPPSSHPMTSSGGIAPVTEIIVVYAATREDGGGVKPKKRPDVISASPVSNKKQKSNSPEGGSTTVMQVLQTSTQMQTPPTTVISTQASAVTLPSASVVQPLVVSSATATTTTTESTRPFSPRQQAPANYATEIVSDSPPERDEISDDKV